MSTLSTSILELGFTSERDMEEALARQVMYGGDLGTNLLELGFLTEDQLLQAASHSTGLPAAPVGELPPTPEPLAHLLPLELCRRHSVHVLGEEEGELRVAVSARLSPQIERELSETAGRPLGQRLATWARIEQALARAGGRNPSERAIRLLKRLEGRPSWTPAGRGLLVDFKHLPRPQSVPPIEFTAAAADFEASTGPPPEGYVELAQAQAIPPRHDTPPHLYVRAPLVPSAVSTRRRGPYTAAMAERDLAEAPDRHAVLAAFFDFSAQYFEYAALFVIKGGEAAGYRARGAGASTERVRAVRVPLDLPSPFVRAREDGTWVLARLKGGGIEGGLARDLARGAGKKVLVLPLLVKGRTVAFLYGDHGSTDVDLTSIGDVLSFAPLASAALEQVILRQKGLAPPRLAAMRPRPAASLPSRDQQAQTLAQLVSRAPTPPPLSSDAEDGSTSETRSALVPLASEARTWMNRRSSAPPFPSQPPGTLPGVVPPGRRPQTLRGVAAPANPPEEGPSGEVAAIPMRPTLSLEPEPLEGAGDVPQGIAPPPPRLIAEFEEPPEDGWDIDATFEEHERGTAAGVGPLPLSVPSSRPTPPLSQQPPSLDSDALVERLCQGDESVLDVVPAADDSILGALVSRFPGPLPGLRSRDNIGKASECGPVLKALLLLGTRAIPYLTVRTADEDAQVREWATRLLGELPSRESAQAVARRLVDESVDVRRAALAASRMTQHVPEAREGTRGQLEELACDGALAADVRRAAIEALTDLREPAAVPCMIRLLADGDREVSGAARWSLVVLTRQDFGADQDHWSGFWATNGTRHRIEWLIDALTHDNRDIRRAAGDELKTLTKEYFGYYDDLPEAERSRVQERYRDWWVQEGAARFT